MGPFTISPACFHLPADKGLVRLSILFAPNKGTGEYSRQFNIACDNGQIMGFTVRGMAVLVHILLCPCPCSGVAESVSVSCVSVGEPSSLELADDSDALGAVTNSVLTIPTVNPHSKSSASVFIKNFG